MYHVCFNLILFGHTGHAYFKVAAQYSQKAVFSFKKGSNGQNHFSSGSCNLIKKSPPAKFLIPHPHPLLLFGKPCTLQTRFHMRNPEYNIFLYLSIMKVEYIRFPLAREDWRDPPSLLNKILTNPPH